MVWHTVCTEVTKTTSWALFGKFNFRSISACNLAITAIIIEIKSIRYRLGLIANSTLISLWVILHNFNFRRIHALQFQLQAELCDPSAPSAGARSSHYGSPAPVVTFASFLYDPECLQVPDQPKIDPGLRRSGHSTWHGLCAAPVNEVVAKWDSKCNEHCTYFSVLCFQCWSCF